MEDKSIEKVKSLKHFTVLWTGQFVSLLGSGLSAFGLSVWIFEKTGSATPFAMSFLSTILPTIIFAPFAGSFADRKRRKLVIMLTDTFDVFLKVLMALLLYFKMMEVWMVYPILFCSSTLQTFQGPAFNASIPALVSQKDLSRANGMMQFSQSSQNMLAPILAGALYPILGLTGLLAVDFSTFIIAIVIISFVKIPQPEVEKTDKSMVGTAFSDFKFSWDYLVKKRGLLSLMLVLGILNFIANISMILLGPLVLSNYDSKIYGTVQAIYGSSMVIGGLVAGLLPNVTKKVKAMFFALIISGIGITVSGFSASWVIISLGFFLFMLPVPYVNSLLQSVIQVKVESNILGRVGALMNAILKLVTPIACVLAGPMADKIFEPLMVSEGALGSRFIGNLIGAGAGRGIGLIFILCGILLIVVCILMLINKMVTSIEDRLPSYENN